MRIQCGTILAAAICACSASFAEVLRQDVPTDLYLLIGQSKIGQSNVAGRVCGRSVDLLAGRTLADFDCLLTDDEAAIARAYSISGGVLRASGEVRAILVTKESYRDFDLSFDMTYPEEGFGDGGIVLWSRMLPDRPDIHTGMEIQTKTGYLGDLWGLSRFLLSRDAATPPPDGHVDPNTNERYRRIPRIADVSYVPGQWLHVDFRRRGPDCELRIDGRLVNRCTVMDAGVGRIGFQTRPYPEGKVPILYKNMILTAHGM